MISNPYNKEYPVASVVNIFAAVLALLGIIAVIISFASSIPAKNFVLVGDLWLGWTFIRTRHYLAEKPKEALLKEKARLMSKGNAESISNQSKLSKVTHDISFIDHFARILAFVRGYLSLGAAGSAAEGFIFGVKVFGTSAVSIVYFESFLRTFSLRKAIKLLKLEKTIEGADREKLDELRRVDGPTKIFLCIGGLSTVALISVFSLPSNLLSATSFIYLKSGTIWSTALSVLLASRANAIRLGGLKGFLSTLSNNAFELQVQPHGIQPTLSPVSETKSYTTTAKLLKMLPAIVPNSALTRGILGTTATVASFFAMNGKYYPPELLEVIGVTVLIMNAGESVAEVLLTSSNTNTLKKEVQLLKDKVEPGIELAVTNVQNEQVTTPFSATPS